MPIMFCSVKELKEQTPKVLKDVEHVDIVVTLHGKPKAILRRFTEEQLGEAISRSAEAQKGLKQAVEDVRLGRTVKLEARHRGSAREAPQRDREL